MLYGIVFIILGIVVYTATPLNDLAAGVISGILVGIGLLLVVAKRLLRDYPNG